MNAHDFHKAPNPVHDYQVEQEAQTPVSHPSTDVERQMEASRKANGFVEQSTGTNVPVVESWLTDEELHEAFYLPLQPQEKGMRSIANAAATAHHKRIVDGLKLMAKDGIVEVKVANLIEAWEQQK